jgi:nitroimidazol reductase NimA-like FMN-containing flavoprotein (pyridoxamine 5'-phosphate oxidase superfamily)
MFGNLNHIEIEEVLKRQLVGRIGCHAEDTTYIVPISYAYDDTYVYGHTFEGMKIDIMRVNSKVCFQVDNLKNIANWQSVIAWGKFEELKDEVQRNHGLQKLMDRPLPLVHSEKMRLTPQWPFPPTDIGSIQGIAFRIRLEEKTGRFERTSDQFYFAT